jgi:lysozyme family protein
VGSDVDGEIGPDTRAAMARLSSEEVVQRYADARRARYRALPHFWRFGRGWLARVDKTLARARALDAARGDADTTRTPNTTTGASDMIQPATQTEPTAKWWGQSITIWGAIITGLSTVLPALGPAIGVDITGDLVREAGQGIVQTVQAVGGLVGTILTIYGRVRASTPLEQRRVQMKL